MVKTRWRWVHCINLKDIAVDLSLEYLAPQEGQNLEWQRTGFYIVFNDFVIVSEHLLNHIHEIIME